ncbi:D-alanyl-D-alanine carboxypeptidase [Paenibacillus sp. CAA11]|uniref:D-alanyl-D-alanine carboxypeptidase family protein n=1 Tax=Paenibacillus sp. CAA11 TaxID=1532905 RepID=UPI000D35AB40|nr:D-alanyl-D-alanine carboxypeptidase family protein [Paenibacillus sp. CAA11]AWB46731.1 D-alanyl-D-alanine carboxypeptidase [Paenibacillus sp. CAA11]
MLINMLCFSVLPAAVLAEGTNAVQTQAAAATTSTSQLNVALPQAPQLNVKSAVLIEASTGQVLLSTGNSNEPLPPASMTKMMTEYIVADLVKQGKLSWDTVVTVKENAAKSIGSRIFLAEGDKHTVKELYIAMAVGSANDATVALAEHVAGSEQAFVKMMNDEAKRMGLKTAYFANATGLSIADMPEKYQPADKSKETVMSAMDAAILARNIVEDHPDFKDFTTIQSYKFRERDKKPIINYNWMLEANASNQNFKKYAYPGLDGMKTGHTNAAGQCFTGTAERNGMRLISVVMGADSEGHRFTETAKVLDYGFNNFEVKQVVAPKSTVKGAETVDVKKGKDKSVPLVTDQEVKFALPKGADLSKVTSKVSLTEQGKLTAPVKAGTKVGTVTYSYKVDGSNQTLQKTVNLITAQEVEKAGWFKLFLRAIGDFFSDLFNSIKNLF